MNVTFAFTAMMAASLVVGAVGFGLAIADAAATSGRIMPPAAWIAVAYVWGAAHAAWTFGIIMHLRHVDDRARAHLLKPYRIYAARVAANGLLAGVALTVARYAFDADDARFRDYLVLLPLGVVATWYTVVHMIVRRASGAHEKAPSYERAGAVRRQTARR